MATLKFKMAKVKYLNEFTPGFLRLTRDLINSSTLVASLVIVDQAIDY